MDQETPVIKRRKLECSPIAQEEKSEPETQHNPTLRGVSEKLLEKIKQKEACRAKFGKPTADLIMLDRLPVFCKMIRSFFINERKTAVLWSCVIQKLTESQTSGLSAESMEEHLYLIKKLLPDWISVVEIRKK